MVGVPLSATSLNTCFFPKTDSGPILRDCVKYKCALRLHILSFPSLYPRASLGDDKQLKWNFYAPRPPHTARPAHPKWSTQAKMGDCLPFQAGSQNIETASVHVP